jgi:hypothetical protein
MTRINGIPANLLAPTPEPKENHDRRHKWDNQNPVGNVDEAIAAMALIYKKAVAA